MDQNASTLSNVLPYRISAEDLRLAVDKVRKLGREALEAALRSKRVYVENALQTLGLATAEIELTDKGRELAYGRDDGSEQQVFLRLVLDYAPFRKALTQCIGGGAEHSDSDAIAAFWGKSRLGVSDQNRKEGALVFLHLCGAAGLGTVLLGRSGAKTRILWNSDAAEHVSMVSEGSLKGAPRVAEMDTSSVDPTRIVHTSGLLPPPSMGRALAQDMEGFRIIFSNKNGYLELPTDLRESEFPVLEAQLNAIMALLKARLAVKKNTGDESS